MHDFYPLTYILHEQYKMLHFKKIFSLAQNRELDRQKNHRYTSWEFNFFLLMRSLNDREPCEVQWCVMIMTPC